MDIIFSHAHCPDGFVAAMIAKRRYPEAEVKFLDHGAPFYTDQVEDKDVLMLDFSLRTKDDNDRVSVLAKSFQIYDHHKTAQAALEGAPYAVFDMNRSGAGLTWDYLFGEDSLIKIPLYVDEKPTGEFIESATYPRPWWVSYTEARDLWRWDSLPNSRAVCAYLGTLPFEFEAWLHLENKTPEDAAILGQGALAHINHYVREAVKQAQTGVFQGYKTAVLNVPYLNCSEIGNELAKTHDVSLTWFERGDGMIQFSLRSIGNIDVSAIAKVFNGGGHRNAAGFQLDLTHGRIVIDKILGRLATYEPERAVDTSRTSGGCVK